MLARNVRRLCVERSSGYSRQLGRTFQLSGTVPHTHETIPGHPVCVDNRTATQYLTGLSHSIGRTARAPLLVAPTDQSGSINTDL